MTAFLTTLGIIALVTACAHFAGIAILLLRPLFSRDPAPAARPPVTLLRPARGIENHIEDTLRSSFTIDYPDYDVIFCVADADDPIIPVIRKLMGEYAHIPAQILTGDDRISINPKLNNLVKGWKAATRDWIVMTDSNVLIPPDYIDTMLARFRPDVGLVCSPALGTQPDGAAAELEIAFLNTHQARWQMLADALGFGFAQGKTMFWKRKVLDENGGIQALGRRVAEDIASTQLVRGAGLKVRLVKHPFPQPLGERTFAEVWSRQQRWAQLRRGDLPQVFAFEILSGGFLPLVAASAWLILSGFSPLWLAVLLVAWYGAEALLAAAEGWYLNWRSPVMWLARDLLLPISWVSAAFRSDYEWRGNKVDTSGELLETPAGKETK